MNNINVCIVNCIGGLCNKKNVRGVRGYGVEFN